MLMPSPYHEEHDGYLQRISRPATAADHRHRPRGHRPPPRRHHFPLHLSVGEMSIGGERKFTGMLHDLTERVQLEEQLRASEARWRAIDRLGGRRHRRHRRARPDRSVQPGGRAAVRLRRARSHRPERQHADAVALSRGARRLPGALPGDRASEDHRHRPRGARAAARTGRRSRCTCRSGRCTIGGERKFTGILHDLSARVRIEEQLREQAALARLGEMAAVIAHEVKNPLAGVRGAIQVIRQPAAPDEQGRGDDQGDRRAIDALEEMMKDMLLFARPPQPRSGSDHRCRASLVAMTAAC